MFDWCEGYERLAPILEDALSMAGETPDATKDDQKGGQSHIDRMLRVLDVGCGTSSLPSSLWNKGQRRVHAVDIDKDVIDDMRSAHEGCEGLTWGVVDLTDAGDELGDSLYNLVVDKGTLDFLICSELRPVLDALAAVRRCLAEGGVLLIISIHPLALWQALIASLSTSVPDALGFEELKAWSIAVDAPQAEGHRPTAALALRRPSKAADSAWTSEARSIAEEAAAAVMDEHFVNEAPLLTPEREAALRADFEAALEVQKKASQGDLSDQLPAAEAHKVMFPSSAEQAEYPLELFLEDFAADPLKISGSATKSEIRLSLEQALKFLRENQ